MLRRPRGNDGLGDYRRLRGHPAVYSCVPCHNAVHNQAMSVDHAAMIKAGLAKAKAEAVALAKRLHRYPVDRRRRSLRDIAAELETAGHITRAGKRMRPRR